MADLQDDQDTTTTSRGASAGMPRWVKVSLIIVAALVVLLVLAKVTGVGGEHGPGRHGGGDAPAEEDGGHRPPFDHGP